MKEQVKKPAHSGAHAVDHQAGETCSFVRDVDCS